MTRDLPAASNAWVHALVAARLAAAEPVAAVWSTTFAKQLPGKNNFAKGAIGMTVIFDA